jgi:hypothetical protein
MEKLITYTLIRLFTKNNNDAIRIFKTIDSLDKRQTPKTTPSKVVKVVRPPKPILPVSKPTQITYTVKSTPIKVVKVVNVSKPVPPARELHKPISKKEELLESLSYFQNKSYQTKDDKESIRMIKVMLKNL